MMNDDGYRLLCSESRVVWIVESRGCVGEYRLCFFFQAEDGIRDFCLSRGLGDVYKRQRLTTRVSNLRFGA